MRTLILPIIALLLLFSGCGGSGSAPDDSTDASTASAETEDLYESGFDEAFSSLAECKGRSKQDVRAFHERRNEGLSGQMLSGDDMKNMNCDYQIRLKVEGREEFRGL